MNETYNKDYIMYYREQGAGGQFRGLSILSWSKYIANLIDYHMALTVLDYGCGAGHQYTQMGLHRIWGVETPALYDPGNANFLEKPTGTFDAVLCSDVMEHVEERHIPLVLDELFAYATKFVWLSVCCRPAKKFFPDGKTNLHITIHPQQWWKNRVKEAQQRSEKKVPFYLVFTQ